MADLVSKSCVDFAAALSSAEPVPGGGGAAALTGTLAASLGAMAARLSAARKKTEAEREALEEQIQIADALRQRLLSLVDWDALLFTPLQKAYSIPKDAPGRAETLRKATLDACEAPMQMLDCLNEVSRLLSELLERVSPLLLSDVGCAAALCHGALRAAAMNVWVNTHSLRADYQAAAMDLEVRRLLTEALPRTERVVAAVEEKLGG